MPSFFIENIAKLRTDWQIPDQPPLDDPSWRTAFTAGDDQTRRNLAVAWLWLLNKNYGTPAINVAQHIDWFRDIHPYLVPQNVPADLPFRGDYDSIFSDLTEDDALGARDKRSLKTLLYHSWLGSRSTRLTSTLKLISWMQKAYEKEETFSHLDQLVAQLAWDLTCEFELSDEQYLQIIKLTIAEVATNYNETPENALPMQHAWHSLALKSIHADSLNVKQRRDKFSDTAVQQESFGMKSLALIYLYEHAQKMEVPGIQEMPQSSLNHKENGVGNVYTMLRKWIPEHAAAWSAAEMLGLDANATALSLCNAAAQNNNTQQLPGDIAGNTAHLAGAR